VKLKAIAPAHRVRACGQQLMHQYHTMLPKSDYVVASMRWVRLSQNFQKQEARSSSSSSDAKISKRKNPGVVVIAGGLLFSASSVTPRANHKSRGPRKIA
jgi:hypothetical protein